MIQKLKNWLSEPLLHFLVAGFFIFVLLGRCGAYEDPDSRIISVNEAKVARLAAGFGAVWKREPTADEIDGLIRDYIREEIYNREAKKLGLDIDDPIIRRRLLAKMEELATAAAESVRPSDEALQKLLNSNPQKYASGGSTSFRQIWLGEKADAAAALAKVKAGEPPETIGKPISLPSSLSGSSPSDIDRVFGENFASQLGKLPLGEWGGPVTSGFGQHLVLVESRNPGKKPTLEQVRQQLENDWRSANIKSRKEKAYQALLDSYDIKIEKPE